MTTAQIAHHRPRGGNPGRQPDRIRLRSSEAAAIEILNERPVIDLDDEAWDDFIAALDAPVEIDPAVKARYARTPESDR